VRKQIARVLGDRVRIFDGGEGTAREMRRRIAEAGLLQEEGRHGSIDFRNSLEDAGKLALCRRLYAL
jgi:glutamate racemase